jgi:hypothetical protein
MCVNHSEIHVKKGEWDDILCEDIFYGQSAAVVLHFIHIMRISLRNRQVNYEGDYYESVIYEILQLLGQKKE